MEILEEINFIQSTTNFDAPDSIEWDLLIKGIKLLKQGKPFNKPIYDP
jgi:uridine kinase